MPRTQSILLHTLQQRVQQILSACLESSRSQCVRDGKISHAPLLRRLEHPFDRDSMPVARVTERFGSLLLAYRQTASLRSRLRQFSAVPRSAVRTELRPDTPVTSQEGAEPVLPACRTHPGFYTAVSASGIP